jgi:tetratricopeptide (TPR) repeat protein
MADDLLGGVLGGEDEKPETEAPQTLAGAIAKLQAANQHGPHWADPLKAWGDVLANQGHWSDALARYDEALKYAPNWAALKQARDAAASHRG